MSRASPAAVQRGFDWHIATVPLAKVAVAGIAFTATTLLVRWLGVEAFGTYATAVALLLLLGGLVVHTLDAALLRFASAMPEEDARAGHVRRATFVLRIGGVCVLALLIALAWASGTWDALSLSLPPGGDVLIVIGIGGMVALGAVSAYLQTTRQFPAYVSLDLSVNVLRLLFVVVLGSSAMLGPSSALACYALAPVLVFIVAFRLFGRGAAGPAGAPASVYLQVGGYCKWVGISVLLQTLYSRLDLLMLNALAGVEAAGIYAAAFSIGYLPELAASFLLVVLYPRITQWSSDGVFRARLLRFLLLAVPFALAGTAVAAMLAEPLLRLLYTDAYSASVPVFQVLVAGTFASFVIIPLAVPYVTLAMPRVSAGIALASVCVMGSGILLLVPAHGAIGAAWAATIARLFVAALILAVVFSHLRAGGSVGEDAPA